MKKKRDRLLSSRRRRTHPPLESVLSSPSLASSSCGGWWHGGDNRRPPLLPKEANCAKDSSTSMEKRARFPLAHSPCWPLSLLTEAILISADRSYSCCQIFVPDDDGSIPPALGCRTGAPAWRAVWSGQLQQARKICTHCNSQTIESGCHIKISSRPPSPTTVLPLLLLSAGTFISCGRHNLNTLKRLGAPTAWVWWPKISNQDALSEKTLVICVVSWRHNSLIFMVAPAGLIFCLMNHCFYCSLVVSWIDSFARGGLLYDFKCYRLM